MQTWGLFYVVFVIENVGNFYINQNNPLAIIDNNC
jgi:hypothetical protein